MQDKVGFGANKLLISVPSCETPAYVDWAINLSSQYWPLGISKEYSSTDGDSNDIDMLRNYSAGYAQTTRTRYIWFLREFCLPPNWAIHRLLEALRLDPKLMIIGAMSPTNAPETVEYDDEVGLLKDENGEEFEVLTVSANNHIGLECTLVRTELFETIGEPWFKSNSLISSDKLLCHRAMDAGFKVCVHSGVVCGHIDESGRSHWPSEVLVA